MVRSWRELRRYFGNTRASTGLEETEMFKPLALAATVVLSLFTMASAFAQVEYGRRGDDRRQNDDRYNQNQGYQNQGEQIRCESRGYNFNRCNVRWRDARIVRQTSNTECRKGQSWGVDRNGLWVDRGCGGVFVEAGGRPGYGPGNNNGQWRPGNNWDRDIRFPCQSDSYNYKMCQVDTGQGGQVRIERQISDTSFHACMRSKEFAAKQHRA